MKRFQECSKLEKIWRYRWYILIPFKFILKCNRYNYKLLWSILIGEAQSNMKWYWTSDEVFNKFKK